MKSGFAAPIPKNATQAWHVWMPKQISQSDQHRDKIGPDSILQRKDFCSCDGGCPQCEGIQTKDSNSEEPKALEAMELHSPSVPGGIQPRLHPPPISSVFVQRKGSGLPPTTPRDDPDYEKQRLEAIDMVQKYCGKIRSEAMNNKISWQAIAGAILWEALENPYNRSVGRLGPAKIRPYALFGDSEAEKVEMEGKITPPSESIKERTIRLGQPDWAITYAAAILRRHAEDYQKYAGVDITNDPGILCTLFQGGDSERRAQELAQRRLKDPNVKPVAGDDMGPWVEKNIGFIEGLCP